MQTDLKVSNIHKAYGDESVYQVLVGCDEYVEDGNDGSDWNIGYNKIRAVKNSNGLYLTVIRSSDGELLFESLSGFNLPNKAIEFGIETYEIKFVL